MSDPRLPGRRAETVRRRAFGPALLAIAVLVAGGGIAMDRMTARQVAVRVEGRSRLLGHMVANLVEAAHDDADVGRVVTALGAERMVDLVAVVNGEPPVVVASTQQQLVGHTIAAIEDSVARRHLAHVLAGGHEEYERSGGDLATCIVPTVEVVSLAAPRRGAVLVRVDGGSIREQAAENRGDWIALLLTLLAAGLLSAEFVLRRYVLRPVEAMAAAIERRRAGDLSARAPVFANDELGRLAHALNEANDGVAAAVRELEFQKFALDEAANVIVTDTQERILYVNDAFCALSGYAREDLLGRTPHLFATGQLSRGNVREMRATLAAGRVWRGEVQNRARDGRTYWVAATILPAQGPDGGNTRFTAVMFDISERKRAEEAAVEAEERFRLVANSAPSLIWMSGTDKKCHFFNASWLAFTGRTLEQELGDGWAEGVHPDDFDRCLATYVEHFDRRAPFEMEYRLRRHDGEYRTIIDRGVPLVGRGEFQGYIGSCVDITERVDAERAVRASEERIRQVIDTALDAVIAIDSEGRIIEWNAQAEQVFGWPAAEATGRLLTETIIPPVYRSAHQRGLARHLRTGEAHVLGQRIEVTALRRDGSEFPIELSISAITRGGRNHYSAFVRDIGERQRAEQELVRAKESAQAASRAKSEFLATMSHEIRTPMNGVIGFTDLLLDTPLDPAQREYADTIRTSGLALLKLINDILDFSKIEAGKLDVEIAPFDGRAVAREAMGLLATRAAERGLDLVLDWPDELPGRLAGDAHRFRQVLLNLAGNAIKFTAAGSVRVEAAVPESGRLRVSVSDTGIGISEQKLAGLFQKFTQADSSTTRRFGGTGLGLAISKQLVTLMHGRIGVESRPGEGSRFWFDLPVAAGAAEGPPELPAAVEPASAARAPAATATAPVAVVPAPAAPAASVSEPAGAAPRLRVLLAEDQPVNQKLALRVLEKLGCRVDLARDGREACALARAREYDVVFMDCHMPEMDGFEATACIRDQESRAIAAGERSRHTPIVALTASVLKEDRDRCFASGMDDFISKPFRADEISAALARWGRPEDGVSEGTLREAA